MPRGPEENMVCVLCNTADVQCLLIIQQNTRINYCQAGCYICECGALCSQDPQTKTSDGTGCRCKREAGVKCCAQHVGLLEIRDTGWQFDHMRVDSNALKI